MYKQKAVLKPLKSKGRRSRLMYAFNVLKANFCYQETCKYTHKSRTIQVSFKLYYIIEIVSMSVINLNEILLKLFSVL